MAVSSAPLEGKRSAQVPLWRTLRDAPQAVRDPVRWFSGLHAEFGDNLLMRVPNGQRILLSRSPTLIRHVLQGKHRLYGKTKIQTEHLASALGQGLLTSEGAYWLRQRRLIQPGFHRDKLARLAAGMQAELQRCEAELDAVARSGEVVDVLGRMMRLTFRIVSRSLFSTDMGDAELDRVEHAVSSLQRHLVLTARRPWVRPWLHLSGGYRQADRLIRDVDTLLLRIIDDRIASGSREGDLLDMLIDARYEDSGEGMSRKQLRDETVILYAAGHETSANAMTWMLDQVARHPDVEQLLLAEYHDLSDQPEHLLERMNLAYTRQVVQESLRHYPPAWATDRISLEPDEVEGLRIPAGQVVLLFLYGAHHHPDYWTEPMRFDPSRFGPHGDERGVREAFFPFGGGPRLCIGNHFALMEMQLALIHLLRRFRFVPVLEKSPVPEPLITLRPLGGMPMRVERR
jgi:cytochrome P450